MDLNFAPVVWPEDRMPLEERDYVECEVCTARSRVVWGEGNPSAPIVIILDNPGSREDKEERNLFAEQESRCKPPCTRWG